MSRRKRQQPKSTQPTRKEILRERKTHRDRQMLLGVLLPIAAIVVVIVGIGMFRELYQQPRQPVARVDGQPITAADYIDRLAYERMQLLNNLQTFSQYAMTSSGNENFLADFARQSREGLPQRTVDMLVDEAIIRTEAEARGIEVTDEDVTEEIYSQLPSTEAFKRLQAGESVTSTATVEELEGEAPPTAEPGDSEIAEAPVGSDVSAGEGITSTSETTATAKVTPTLSAEVIAGATKGANDDYESIVRQGVLARTGISEGRYREIVRSQLFRKRLQEALAGEVEATAEQVDVAHMVFESEATAAEAKAALDEGEKWDDVVARFRDPSTTEPITDTAGTLDLGTTGALTTTTGVSGTEDSTATVDDLEDPAELLAQAGITATSGVTETGPLSGTLGTPAPSPTPVPSPFFKSLAERAWVTRQGLKDTLGLSDEEVTTLFDTKSGKAAGPMAGRDGSYVIVVYDMDKDRELPKEELETKKAGALDAWLQTKRIQVGVDRFPLDGLTPEEPEWFATLYEQIVGVPVNALPTDALSISTVPAPVVPIATVGPAVVTAPAP